MNILRWLPRLLIPLAIAAALVIDALDDRTPLSAVVEDPEALTQVVVPPPDALTSSWFCAVVGMRAPVQGFGEVTSELLLTNMTAETASVSVEFRGRTTGRQFVTADVAPHSTGVVTTSDYVRDEVIGALVEATSGGLAVTRRLVSPLGVDEARCSSTLAPNWFVPVGDTQADALGVLAIMNPLPRDAIVDVTFASEAEFGPFVAPALTGVVVPAWSTVVVDVGEHARRRDVVAASVSARTGRIAVDSFLAYDGSVGRRGLAAELASVASGDRWLVPVAGIDDRTHLWLRVFNPSDDVAEVSASVASHDSRSDRVAFAVASHDVMELQVEPPGELAPGLATLLAPTGAPFGIAVESQNGVPIVVWAETLVGSAASPLTDIGAASASVSAAGNTEVPDSGGESTTVVAQTGGTQGADAPVGDAASDEGDDESPVEILPPVHRAQSGLAFVPGIVRTSDRWLVVIAPESGGEALLTIMTDPLAAADADGSQDDDSSVSTNSDRRVVVETLGRETVAFIDVPASGVVTHRLASGTTRLLVSDTPFAVLLWQARSGTQGLSVAHPLVW
ncbi:hypothetical protein [Candidatus Poriferisodalis sp.]|uniref:hypothetical protein n=1 Tax=Candidatus Poriferisodalis sp. TaxID=3101277 RepID=UPI003B517448